MVRIGVRSKPTNRALWRLNLGLIYGHSIELVLGLRIGEELR